jgi:hypothetical protein
VPNANFTPSAVGMPRAGRAERDSSRPRASLAAAMKSLSWPTAFRWLVVLAQGAMIVLTWPLWQVRQAPPLLPALPLPEFDMGWLLLGSLAVVLIHASWGLTLHAAVLLLAMLMDQTRMQPQAISCCLLILGTLPGAGPQLIGRMHLISLWFFSGFHKLISSGYFEQVARHLWVRLVPWAPPSGSTYFGLVIAGGEIALAILALIPRTRRLAALIAIPFHLGIFLSLSPWGINWNESVWAWNIALAGAGMGLLWNWREPWPVTFSRTSWGAIAAAFLLLASPLGYYLGIVDAYLAHCLYSANTPTALWRRSDEVRNLSFEPWATLHVPLPPTHRTFEAYFRAVAEPGDSLAIEDPRWCAQYGGYSHREIPFAKRVEP